VSAVSVVSACSVHGKEFVLECRFFRHQKTLPVQLLRSLKHPFILEFPLKASDLDEITNYRRIREHHRLTQLLNVLLRGGTSFQLPRS
jgi:hypothetical protein